MGTTAQPGVSYCTGETQAALSVGSQVFTTQNPPISYTLVGTTATISDATGVIGTADLTGELVLANSTAASQSIPYCSGQPKAVLKWDGGQVESTNAPISYAITTQSEKYYFGTYRYLCDAEGDIGGGNTNPRMFSSGPYNENTEITFSRALLSACTNPVSAFSGNIYSTSWTGATPATRTWMQVEVYGFFKGRGTPSTAELFAAGLLTTLPATGSGGDGTVITTPVEPLQTFYTLTVTDSTGVIGTYEYESEPTGFVVDCYDYDIKEVNYVCNSECPAGTEFQCRCEESNTLMCYGYDPDNPDVFKPLYTTTITN